MASGKYCIIAPSFIDIDNDVEIFYTYQADRQTEPEATLNILTPSQVITTFKDPSK